MTLLRAWVKPGHRTDAEGLGVQQHRQVALPSSAAPVYFSFRDPHR
jgi:hypothetical protein